MQSPSALADPIAATLAGGLTLDEWMKAEGLDDAKVGEMLGRDRITVYRIRTGRAKPSHDFIEGAIAASKGAVDGNSFFKRALTTAAASRGGDGSEAPFSSTSSRRARRADAGRPVPPHASGPASSPAGSFRPPMAAPRSRPSRSGR